MTARSATMKKSAQQSVHPAVPAIAAFGLSLGFLFAALSGQFTVRQIQVVGKGLPVGIIDQSARVEGANIFTVRSDTVVANLANVRGIAVQRVDVTFPDRVTIYARKRRAMAAWETASGLYLLDPEGRIIRAVKRTRLPIITSTQQNGSLGPGIVEAVREAVKLLPPIPNGAIARFSYDPRTGLTIRGTSGWQAIVGNGSRRALATRIATLAAVLKQTNGLPPPRNKIDLRNQNPYITSGT